MEGEKEKLLQSLGLWEKWGNTRAPYPGVIALVGGGGKTTTMGNLAREAAQAGRRALKVTSTHIAVPEEGTLLIWMEDRNVLELRRGGETREYPPDVLDDGEFGKELFGEQGSVLTAGALCREDPEKLTALPADISRRLRRLADVVFVEADGAKRLPLKIPASHEPALEKETEAVICCAGLSALDSMAADTVFRRELYPLRGDEPVTEELMGEILASDRGGRKKTEGLEYRVILNQCDTREQTEAAERIGSFLASRGIRGAAVSWGKTVFTF